jgi:hypothetical protein
MAVETNDAQDENDANGQDMHDDFLDPDMIGSGPRTKHPDEIGEGWHPGRDFIDPLADELEEWRRASEGDGFDYTEPTTLDRLTYIIAGIVVGGPGSDPQAAAWRRARARFDMRGPAGFRDRFAKRVKGVWKKIESLERRLKDWQPADDSSDEDDDGSLNEHTAFEFTGFLVTVIEPFIADLRNWSRELKELFPLPKETPALGNEPTGTARNHEAAATTTETKPRGKGELKTAAKHKPRKGRGKWPKTRTDPAVAQYLSENTNLLNELVPLVLQGDAEGFKRFKAIFGATAIARAITKKAGVDQEDICKKSHVQKTETYRHYVSKLFKRPPERPVSWLSREEKANLSDFVRELE